MGFPGVAKYLAVIYSVMLLHKPRSTQKKMTFTSLTIYLLSIGAGRGGGGMVALALNIKTSYGFL